MSHTALFYIFEGLKHNNGLERLGLENCSITSRDAEFLAGALTVNKCLTSLNLDGNYIADSGVIFIAEALRHNNTLRTLDIGNSAITHQSMHSL